MIRMRYKETNDGTCLESHIETKNLGAVIIIINLVKMSYSIVSEVGTTLAKGTAKDRVQALAKVKANLMRLGVYFPSEFRHSKKKLKNNVKSSEEGDDDTSSDN